VLTATAPPCTDSFEEQKDTNARGADLNAGLNTEQCKAKCLTITSCVGFDFDGNCWIHNNSVAFAQTASAPGVSHWKRVTNCGKQFLTK